MSTTYDFLNNPMHPNPTDFGLPRGVIFAHQFDCETWKFVVH